MHPQGQSKQDRIMAPCHNVIFVALILGVLLSHQSATCWYLITFLSKVDCVGMHGARAKCSDVHSAVAVSVLTSNNCTPTPDRDHNPLP